MENFEPSLDHYIDRLFQDIITNGRGMQDSIKYQKKKRTSTTRSLVSGDISEYEDTGQSHYVVPNTDTLSTMQIEDLQSRQQFEHRYVIPTNEKSVNKSQDEVEKKSQINTLQHLSGENYRFQDDCGIKNKRLNSENTQINEDFSTSCNQVMCYRHVDKCDLEHIDRLFHDVISGVHLQNKLKRVKGSKLNVSGCSSLEDIDTYKLSGQVLEVKSASSNDIGHLGSFVENDSSAENMKPADSQTENNYVLHDDSLCTDSVNIDCKNHISANTWYEKLTTDTTEINMPSENNLPDEITEFCNDPLIYRSEGYNLRIRPNSSEYQQSTDCSTNNTLAETGTRKDKINKGERTKEIKLRKQKDKRSRLLSRITSSVKVKREKPPRRSCTRFSDGKSDNIKLIFPKPAPEGLWRSQRTRVPPLEWHKNERIIYDRGIISGITLSSEIKIKQIQELKAQKKEKENRKTKDEAELKSQMSYLKKDTESRKINYTRQKTGDQQPERKRKHKRTDTKEHSKLVKKRVDEAKVQDKHRASHRDKKLACVDKIISKSKRYLSEKYRNQTKFSAQQKQNIKIRRHSNEGKRKRNLKTEKYVDGQSKYQDQSSKKCMMYRTKNTKTSSIKGDKNRLSNIYSRNKCDSKQSKEKFKSSCKKLVENRQKMKPTRYNSTKQTAEILAQETILKTHELHVDSRENGIDAFRKLSSLEGKDQFEISDLELLIPRSEYVKWSNGDRSFSTSSLNGPTQENHPGGIWKSIVQENNF